MPSTLENTAIEVLYSNEQIQERLDRLAEELNRVYADTDELIVVCILKGGFMFTSDLVRRLTVPCQIEFVRLASYEGQNSSGRVKPVDLSLPQLTGKDVLLLEDIVDTGITLNFFMDYVKSLHIPKSLRLAVLLDKKEARKQPVHIDYACFDVDNRFVIGYGLDNDGFYRNLPYIGWVRPD